MEPIVDAAKLNAAVAYMRELVESSYRLALSVAKSRNWHIVPVESASHFDTDDAARVAAACSAFGYSECLAVATEELDPKRLCYRIKMSRDSLLSFSHECGHFNYVIYPDDVSFAVLCTVLDYYLVAGSQEFVISALGSDIEVARRKFLDFANDEFWSPSERERLLKVAEVYAETEL